MQSRRSSIVSTTIVCAILLLIFAASCYIATMTKSATNDEPLHEAGGYAHVFMHDYRVNPEDPPLWNYWYMLPFRADSFHIPTDESLWQRMMDDTAWSFAWSSMILFTAENEGPRRIDTSRAMMVVVAVALGVVIAMWSFELAGAAGAIVATMLFAFDPNFLGHGALVKNDVPISLLICAMSWALFRCGKRATVWNIAAAVLILGAGLNTKFSGVLMLPMFALVMLARASLSVDWPVLGRTLTARTRRFAFAGAMIALALLVSWTMTWASYGFRFDPTPKPGARLPFQRMVDSAAGKRIVASDPGHVVTTEDLEAAKPSVIVRIILFAERHRLLPQAWLYGFLYTYQSSIVRESFLLGKFSATGWRYYFPLAMLFKTPTATLIAIAATIVFLLCNLKKIRSWPALAILIPFGIYALSAITTHLNIGVRHVFPLYPFIFIAIGVGAARFARFNYRAFLVCASALAIGLMIESASAFPDYIAFFNFPSGGARGGIRLLSDSNLDWGQDLPLLAEWQRKHPNTRLYFGYSGSSDPSAYGIKYINMPHGYPLNPQSEYPSLPGVIAISSTRLQGVYLNPEQRAYYTSFLRTQTPREVLGGTIYLYDFPGNKTPASKSSATEASTSGAVGFLGRLVARKLPGPERPACCRYTSSTMSAFNPADAIRNALVLHRAGDLQKAREIYQQVLDAEPNNASALHYLGMIEQATGNRDAGDELIRKSLAIKPEQPSAWNNLGTSLMEGGHVDEAIAALSHAVELKPDYAIAFQNLARCLQITGDVEASVRASESQLKIDPNSPDAQWKIELCRREIEAMHAPLRDHADRPKDGRWFTTIITCFGDFPQLSIRCLDSILSTPNLLDRCFAHVGCNVVCDATRDCARKHFEAKRMTTLIESNRNLNKGPMVRMNLLNSDTPYVLIVDDDSHVQAGWLDAIVRFIERNHPFDVAGHIFNIIRANDPIYQAMVEARPWWKGLDVGHPAYRAKPFFATGGFYLARLAFLREHNYPDRAVRVHREDVMLGDLTNQVGGKLLRFPKDVMDKVRINDGETRGVHDDAPLPTAEDFVRKF